MPFAPPVAADSERPPIPERLGKYELLRQIATGGMAEIHLARAVGIEGFEKLVVLKRLLPELTDDAVLVQMFLDEARLAATLHHSNIVQVHDVGAEGGSYFMAMEFLHGQDLWAIQQAARAASRPIPLEHAISVAIGVCAGLHYAHEKADAEGKPLSIVHRDVSPQNVIVTYEGAVKIVDFGIAEAANRRIETQAGVLKGKYPYMSPEQVRCEPLDRRSDIFSLAVVLYELTTGHRLYPGRTKTEVLHAILESKIPRPSFYQRDYPPELDHIVMRGLARARYRRYDSAQLMQLDLEDFAREKRLPISPVSLSRFLDDLFADDIRAMQDARGDARTLANHVAGRVTRRLPVEDVEDDPPPGIASVETEPIAAAAVERAPALIAVVTTRLLWIGRTRAWRLGLAVSVALALALALFLLTGPGAERGVPVRAPALGRVPTLGAAPVLSKPPEPIATPSSTPLAADVGAPQPGPRETARSPAHASAIRQGAAKRTASPRVPAPRPSSAGPTPVARPWHPDDPLPPGSIR